MIVSKIHRISFPQDISSLYEKTLRLPEWRRRKVLSYHLPIDRLQCVIAYELLAALLEESNGIDLADKEIIYSPLGKPSLKGIEDIFISLSHCREAIMAVISDRPVGCDVEAIPVDNGYEEIVDCFYSDREKSQIRYSDNPAAEFTKIWTVKESVFKLDNSIQIETFDTAATDYTLQIKQFETFITTIAY